MCQNYCAHHTTRANVENSLLAARAEVADLAVDEAFVRQRWLAITGHGRVAAPLRRRRFCSRVRLIVFVQISAGKLNVDGIGPQPAFKMKQKLKI